MSRENWIRTGVVTLDVGVVRQRRAEDDGRRRFRRTDGHDHVDRRSVGARGQPNRARLDPRLASLRLDDAGDLEPLPGVDARARVQIEALARADAGRSPRSRRRPTAARNPTSPLFNGCGRSPIQIASAEPARRRSPRAPDSGRAPARGRAGRCRRAAATRRAVAPRITNTWSRAGHWPLDAASSTGSKL